jgi:hypothetical protein
MVASQFVAGFDVIPRREVLTQIQSAHGLVLEGGDSRWLLVRPA